MTRRQWPRPRAFRRPPSPARAATPSPGRTVPDRASGARLVAQLDYEVRKRLSRPEPNLVAAVDWPFGAFSGRDDALLDQLLQPVPLFQGNEAGEWPTSVRHDELVSGPNSV